jgi:hypothetical protein
VVWKYGLKIYKNSEDKYAVLYYYKEMFGFVTKFLFVPYEHENKFTAADLVREITNYNSYNPFDSPDINMQHDIAEMYVAILQMNKLFNHTFINFEVSNYWDNVQGAEAMRQVKEMVIQCTTRLRAAIERLPYNVEMSQFVVGSGMTESQWNASYDGGGFTQYKTYLLEHTDDDKGIQRITKIFLGINLD